MIQVIDTGNVKTVMRDGIRLFDIEFSYAVDVKQRRNATDVLEAMVDAFNAEEINIADDLKASTIIEFSASPAD